MNTASIFVTPSAFSPAINCGADSAEPVSMSTVVSPKRRIAASALPTLTNRIANSCPVGSASIGCDSMPDTRSGGMVSAEAVISGGFVASSSVSTSSLASAGAPEHPASNARHRSNKSARDNRREKRGWNACFMI